MTDSKKSKQKANLIFSEAAETFRRIRNFE